ncbi:MAG: dienelactone hydrolase family protein [Clostridia bacterium]|nr:dienelactone hydrolase family protein [Clostridia bacterium]
MTKEIQAPALREEKRVTEPYKQEYVRGVKAVIEARQEEAREARRAYAVDIFKTPEQYRADLCAMLGWPLDKGEVTGIPEAVCELLSHEDGYTLFRMRFEVLPGLWMTGLHFRLHGEGRRPLAIVQHGGLGTPELITGLWGSTGTYHDIALRVLREGCHVFCPQLLLWDEKEKGEVCDTTYNRTNLDARLKRVGSSVTAIEVYGIRRILNYFEAEDYVSALGMVGLSYGGFYTLYTAALDTRIRAAVSCSWYNTRDAHGWSDWTWPRSAYLFDDAEVACLIYPRQLYVAIGEQDEVFKVESGRASMERLRDYCREVGEDWLTLSTFEGKHEFFRDDAPLAAFAKRLNE